MTDLPDGEGPSDLAVAVGLLRSARSLLLLAHDNPDADTLGSALALGLGLRRRGAAVAVSFDRPASVPQSLAGLPGVGLVTPADDWLPGGRRADTPLDLIVTLDAGSAERLGRLATLFGARAPVLVIDHHVSNTRFGDHHLVDPAADATVVLVDLLLAELGVVLDADVASLLYAGLATDTGGFARGGADGHRLAARLLDAGVDPATLLRPITDSHPFGWLAMLTTVLGRAKLDPSAVGGRGVVHTCVTVADQDGLRQEESDAVIDIVRTVTQAQVAIVAKQTGEELWQVSLRSHPGVDVGAAAGALGGGGHPQAAGFTWRGGYPAVIDAVIEHLGAVRAAGR